AVPCMTDNFCYVLVDASGPGLSGGPLSACAVDPADAAAVVEALAHLSQTFYAEHGGLRLEAVLCTHKHWDHAGGNADLVHAAEAAKRAEVAALAAAAAPPAGAGSSDGVAVLTFAHPLHVFSGEHEYVPACSRPMRHGECFWVGGLNFEVVASPGHTCGSIMFRLANSAASAADLGAGRPHEADGSREALFTGDTLFSGGCGAQFEGSSLDTEHCFATILAACGPGTLLFPGHEYTCRLLGQRVLDAAETWAPREPPGQFLNLCGAFYAAAHRQTLRDRVPTVPCTLASERLVNPNFDRSLRRHADVLLALLEAQAGPAAEAAGGAASSAPLLARSGPGPPAVAAEEPPGALQPGRGAGEGSSSSFLTRGGSCDDLPPFAFYYRADIELLRRQLAGGEISGPAAAARLAECERRVFGAALLTGEGDLFSDEGLLPQEEDPETRWARDPLAPPGHRRDTHRQ
ncbi:unnamed protein product, partial [Prorocentrum cordatum]